MGLDMYLDRYPRYKHYRPKDINNVESFLDYVNNSEAKEKYTLKEWCGIDPSSLPPQKDIEKLMKFYDTRYWAWDSDHQYPHKMIHEPVAYWRKANAIHKWFVDNIQDGEDDCSYHREVTEENLKNLIDICETILNTVELKEGKVLNGYKWTKEGKEEAVYESGEYVVNPEVCERLLPSESGFFFGSTDYDQWYIKDIKYTHDTLRRILKETDFETQMLFYVSSW